MTNLILSTSNIMGGGPSLIRRPTTQKSNTEFTSSLRIHFSAAKHAAASHTDVHMNGANGDSHKKPPYQKWTTQVGKNLFIPSLDFSKPGLAEERGSYEITVKLFFIPNIPASCRCAQTREAVDLVLKELQIPSIDLLIVSYPGIAFDAEDEDDEEAAQFQREAAASSSPHESIGSAEDVDTMIETWKCLEELHDKGNIGRLGVAEFGTERLSRFLKKARVRPSVNQINVRDCCVVPRPLIIFAKQEKVELLTHNDCTDILPRGTVREMLGSGENGADVLSSDGSRGLLKGDVEPQWVIKYTAVVRNRGVIENKGYFAMAQLR